MKTLFSNVRVAAMLLFGYILIASCDSTNNSDITDPELMPLSSVTVDGVTLSLFADSELETGYNDLYWTVEENGERLTPASITLTPMMDMMTMSHSTPFSQPEAWEDFDGYYSSMAIFIMPGGDMGSWSIDAEIVLQDQRVISTSLPIEVGASWRQTSIRNGEQVYYLTWKDPQTPRTGNNEFRFMIHTRASMMNYPAVTDAELIVFPYMDMGGGSGHSTPFNTPESVGGGLYEGSINYSMSGDWTTSVQIVTASGDTLPETTFEYRVQAQ